MACCLVRPQAQHIYIQHMFTNISAFCTFSPSYSVIVAMLKALRKVGNKMVPKKASDHACEGHGEGGWHLEDYATDELIGKIFMFYEAQVLA